METNMWRALAPLNWNNKVVFLPSVTAARVIIPYACSYGADWVYKGYFDSLKTIHSSV